MFRPITPKVLQTALAVISLSIISAQVIASTVIMKDGSSITGEIVSKKEGTLILATSFAGDIKIQWDQVAEIKTPTPIKIHAADNSIIETTHIVNTEESDAVLTTEKASDTVSLTNLDSFSINPEPWELGEAARFTGLVDLGFQIDTGNTESETINSSTALHWQRINDRWNVVANFERETTNDVVTEDNWQIESDYDYFVSENWYVGIYGQLEQDRIANLDQRLLIGPLVGHQFWQSDESNLSTELGVVYVDEQFNFDPNSNDPFDSSSTYTGIRWNLKYDKYIFKDIIQFYYKNDLLVDATEVSDKDRTVFKAVVGARVFLVENLSAGAEFQYDYDGTATGETKKEDTKTVIKLGYSW